MRLSTAAELFSQQTLPDGSQELRLNRRGSRRELFFYGILTALVLAGGLWLASTGRVGEGALVCGIGVLLVYLMLREIFRTERWTLRGRDAHRLVTMLGLTRRIALRDVERVVVTRQTDSDDRDLRRVCLQHAGKSTRVGADFDNDERVLRLARTLADTLGVPLALPPGH
jgi:hypothetical protein